MSTTIDKFQSLYQMLYDHCEYAPHNGMVAWRDRILPIKPKYTKALDVGCGLGEGVALARGCGLDTWGVDIADVHDKWAAIGIADYCQQAPAHKIPYPDNTFDFVTCTDVMEHIPAEYVIPSLSEIYRVGSKYFYFVMDSELEKYPPINGIYTHVTLKPCDEWADIMVSIGYKIIATVVDADHCTITAEKELNENHF